MYVKKWKCDGRPEGSINGRKVDTLVNWRITKDLEPRMTSGDLMVLSFTLAVNRRKKDDPADFISCKAFGKTAETMANYLRKGSLIGVTGRIQTGKYDNKEGRTIYTCR